MTARSRRVVVLGGGVSGLATAALLARDGHDVELVEARDALGGRAGSWEREGFRFDTGPSWYLMPEVFDHFFRLLGTSAAEQLDLRTLDPGYRVLFEDHAEPLDVAADLEENVRRFEALQPGAGAALRRYVETARDTYRIAVDRFLYTSFETPRAFLSPAVLRRAGRLARLLLQPLEGYVADRFRDPRLRQVLGYPAVFLGSTPARTPSLYHLMSSLDLTGGVQYPQGGFAGLVDAMEHLAREHGVRIRTGTTAERILTTPGGPGRTRARVRGLAVRAADGTRQELAADVVVTAADLHQVEHELLPADLRSHSERWWRRRDPGPGGVLVLLGVRGRVPELAHHTLFFTRDWEANFGAIAEGRPPSPASSYVCRPSATDPGVAPEGDENLFVLVPAPADPDLGRGGEDGGGSATVERLADEAVDQISRWAGIPDLAERIVVRRTIGPGDFAEDLRAWRGGMLGPAHTLGQSAFLRAGNRSRRVHGLLHTGATTIPGIGLPMCLISAELVVKRLRADRSPHPLAAPLPDRRAAPAPSSVDPRGDAPAWTPTST